jgi:hypothetical protein
VVSHCRTIAAGAAAVGDTGAAAALRQPAPARPRVEHYVDLNSASRKELMTLPGIGAQERRRIVANRPYLTKTELVTKNVLRSARSSRVRHLVVAMRRRRSKGRHRWAPPSLRVLLRVAALVVGSASYGQAASAPARAAAPAAPGERGRERTGETAQALAAARSVQRRRRGHLPRLHDDVSSTYSAGAIFKTKHAFRKDARARSARRAAMRGVSRTGSAPRREQEPGLDQQPEGDVVADAAGAQPAVPRLPPGRRAHRLACELARTQQPRVQRLPQGASGARDPVLVKASHPRSASPATARSAPISRRRRRIQSASA